MWFKYRKGNLLSYALFFSGSLQTNLVFRIAIGHHSRPSRFVNISFDGWEMFGGTHSSCSCNQMHDEIVLLSDNRWCMPIFMQNLVTAVHCFCGVLVGKAERNRFLCRPKRRCEGNTEMNREWCGLHSSGLREHGNDFSASWKVGNSLCF